MKSVPEKLCDWCLTIDSMESIEALVARLGLEPHPEGGFFKRIYTARTPMGATATPRPCATSILYLLPRGLHSSLHTLGSDELWLYQAGSPLTVVQVGASGEVTETPVLAGAPVLVPAGALFGAYLGAAAGAGCPGQGAAAAGAPDYALVCCVVVPGFEWAEFVMPPKEALLAQFAGKAAALEAVARLAR